MPPRAGRIAAKCSRRGAWAATDPDPHDLPPKHRAGADASVGFAQGRPRMAGRFVRTDEGSIGAYRVPDVGEVPEGLR